LDRGTLLESTQIVTSVRKTREFKAAEEVIVEFHETVVDVLAEGNGVAEGSEPDSTNF